MRRHGTAGKGPGIVLRAQNGAMRLGISLQDRRGFLEILESSGASATVLLKPGDLKELAKALQKVAAALEVDATGEEITQH